MTAAGGAIAQNASTARDAAAWVAVRADPSLQFAPVAPPVQPEPPQWLLALGRLLGRLLRPLGELLGLDWRWLQWLLIGLATLGALWLLWTLVLQPLLAKRRASVPGAEEEWSPQREAALALLEDADQLAAAGRFGEAAHLLLQRSVGEIARARPGWLAPSSTAREIGALGAMPERARRAFATIAAVVERSLFGLRGAEEGDWRCARAAYTDFALTDLSGART